MVAAAAFAHQDAAIAAIALLRESGVRAQDISVVTNDQRRGALVAGDRAWLPLKGWRGLMARVARATTGGVPKEVKRRYAKVIHEGRVVIVVAAGGQPSDTIAALLAQSHGDLIDQWWQPPAMLFAPPELAGPF